MKKDKVGCLVAPTKSETSIDNVTDLGQDLFRGLFLGKLSCVAAAVRDNELPRHRIMKR